MWAKETEMGQVRYGSERILLVAVRFDVYSPILTLTSQNE